MKVVLTDQDGNPVEIELEPEEEKLFMITEVITVQGKLAMLAEIQTVEARLQEFSVNFEKLVNDFETPDDSESPDVFLKQIHVVVKEFQKITSFLQSVERKANSILGESK